MKRYKKLKSLLGIINKSPSKKNGMKSLPNINIPRNLSTHKKGITTLIKGLFYYLSPSTESSKILRLIDENSRLKPDFTPAVEKNKLLGCN